MHYDFKMKLNKIDSQQYRNLQVPEIDWMLNNALRLFVKFVAFPRQKSLLGFEVVQRNTDDIRTLLKEDKLKVVDNFADLPEDYWHFISAKAVISKGMCVQDGATINIRQHDDNFEESPFDNSSFEWKVVNATFIENKLEFYAKDFSVDFVKLKYIKEPVYIHNAEDFRGGQYYNLKGELLTGTQDSELPHQTDAEIVDIAVMIATNAIQIPDYQNKLNKLKLNLN